MRARLCCAFLCLWLGSSAAAAAAPGAEEPRDRALPLVRLIATGGTIAVHAGGRLSAEDLVASVPGLDRVARVETEQFANVASSRLTLRQWAGLARRINALLGESGEPAAVVVTSGTDTLEELAYFLHLTVRSDKPVVVVGAMRDASTPGGDGAANLLGAIRVAAAAESRGKGVLVVMNDEINSAREVTKTDAQRVQAFESGPYGVLGLVYEDGPVYGRVPLRRHTGRSEFDVSEVEELPRVDIVLTYQGAPGDVVRALVEQGARGLVMAAAGAGSLSGTQAEGLRHAREKGVPVVIATRTGGGRVAAPTAHRQGVEARGGDDWIAAGDLAPLKARVLLMLALTRTTDAAEIQRMFDEY